MKWQRVCAALLKLNHVNYYRPFLADTKFETASLYKPHNSCGSKICCQVAIVHCLRP